MYRSAISAILSELLRQERLIVVDSFSVDSPKTRELLAKLKAANLSNVLIVTDGVDANLELSARNLINVEVTDSKHADPVSLIGFEKVLMTVAALRQFEEVLG